MSVCNEMVFTQADYSSANSGIHTALKLTELKQNDRSRVYNWVLHLPGPAPYWGLHLAGSAPNDDQRALRQGVSPPVDVHRHGMIKGMIHWISPVGRIKAMIDLLQVLHIMMIKGMIRRWQRGST